MMLYTPVAKRMLFCFLFLWSLIIFMPGSYSVDSYNYYYQFANKQYNDWHPPIMAFVWKCLYMATHYLESIYIAQMVLYWIMGYILLAKINTNKITYWVGIGLFILFQFIPQYIMKDAQQVTTWGLASALILYNMQLETAYRGKALVNILIVLLLSYGLLVRINAIAAIVPLLYMYLDVSLPKLKAWWKKVGIAVAVIAVLLVANNFITYTLLHATKTYPQYKLRLLDVTGISKATGKNYLPAEVTSHPGYDSARLMKEYTVASFDHIYWPVDGSVSMVPPPDEAINNSVAKAWQKAIAEHPFVYLKNRMEGYLYYLRIKKRFEKGEYWDINLYMEPNNPLQLTKPQNSYSNLFWMGSFKGTLFFAPWFWLLLNPVFTIYYWRKYKSGGYKEYMVMACIQLSGLLYGITQFPIFQHDRDFRYSYWNVVVFIIGFVYMIGRPYKKVKQA